MIAGPGDETAAVESRSRGDLRASHADREQVIGTLKTAFVEGRLTEDERDARAAQVSASRCHADLASLVADLPAGLATRPPTTRDVRTGVCVIIAAAGVLAAVLLSNPDDRLAFMVFLFAAATLIVAPVMTVGLIFDVRHQKRSGEAGVLGPRAEGRRAGRRRWSAQG